MNTNRDEIDAINAEILSVQQEMLSSSRQRRRELQPQLEELEGRCAAKRHALSTPAPPAVANKSAKVHKMEIDTINEEDSRSWPLDLSLSCDYWPSLQTHLVCLTLNHMAHLCTVV